MKHQEKNELLEKNRILIRYFYGIVLLAISGVYFLDDRSTLSVEKSASKNASQHQQRSRKLRLLLRILLMRKTYEPKSMQIF